MPAHTHLNERSRLEVLVASPSTRLRKRWTGSLPRNTIIHEVRDRTALMISIGKLCPSVVLLHDILLEPCRAKNLAKLRALDLSAKIIVLSQAPKENDGIAALKAGAEGYCNKNVEPILIGKAVRKVLRGELWIGRKLVASLIREFCRLSYEPCGGEDHIFDSLTRRELEVARLISRGSRNKEISGQLGVSEATIKAHLTAIFKKLDMSDRLNLAIFLVANAAVLNKSTLASSKTTAQSERPTAHYAQIDAMIPQQTGHSQAQLHYPDL